MRLNTTQRYAVLMLVIAPLAFPQQNSIRSEIQKVYDFQPHLLNKVQTEQKSQVLDQFWAKAKQQQAIYVPALRRELADFRNPPFFLYDGSMLLLSLSSTPADHKIALGAVARCDLQDLNTTEYFQQVHQLAALNEDTTVAALHVLDRPDFAAIVPQHALSLGQNYSLIYLLMPIEQSRWEGPAIARLGTEVDETAQKSLLLLLWYAQTETADKAISQFVSDKAKSALARAYGTEILVRKLRVGIAQRAQALVSTEESLRQKRRTRMKTVSDEALIELDELTFLLMAKRK